MNFPIYLISMEKDTSRREKLKALFPASYEKFTLVQAVNGAELSAGEYFNSLSHASQLLTPGEVGCALSHINALEMFLRSDAECALILEDDVIGDDDGIFLLSQILEKMSGEFFIHCGEGLGRRIWLRKSVGQLYKLPPPRYMKLSSAFSYVVTKTVARSIIEKQKHELHLADDWRYLLSGADCNLYYAGIFDHPEILDGQSLLGPDRKIAQENESWMLVIPESKPSSSCLFRFWVYSYKIHREISRVLKQICAYLSGYRLIRTKDIRALKESDDGR